MFQLAAKTSTKMACVFVLLWRRCRLWILHYETWPHGCHQTFRGRLQNLSELACWGTAANLINCYLFLAETDKTTNDTAAGSWHLYVTLFLSFWLHKVWLFRTCSTWCVSVSGDDTQAHKAYIMFEDRFGAVQRQVATLCCDMSDLFEEVF